MTNFDTVNGTWNGRVSVAAMLVAMWDYWYPTAWLKFSYYHISARANRGIPTPFDGEK